MNNNIILRVPEVSHDTGLSRSTIYSLVKRGEFPAPISLSERAVGWLSSDIQAWIEQRAAASQAVAKMGGDHV